MPKRQLLSGTETDLMKSLWKLGESTVPDLVTALNQRRPKAPITRGTIQVLLNRVETKGWVKRRKAGRGFIYKPVTTEAVGLAELTGQFRTKVFDGSALNLVQSLVKTSKLQQDDIDELRALLDQAEENLEKGERIMIEEISRWLANHTTAWGLLPLAGYWRTLLGGTLWCS